MSNQTFRIADICRADRTVNFQRYRKGVLYYTVYATVADGESYTGGTITAAYTFPVPLSDVGDATLLRQDKSILFMRWIRKAIEDGTFVRIRG